MREADQYVQLRENPTSKNVLKLIRAMSTENMKFEEAEINDIVEQIKDEFKVEHQTVKEFDEELWQILEKVQIDLDWTNVINSYGDDDYKCPNPELIRQTINKMRSESADIGTSIEQRNDTDLEPRMFIRVEETFKNNASIEKLKEQRILLSKTLWELYDYSPLKRDTFKKSKYLINWDLTFNLITLTYTKILEKEESTKSEKSIELKDENANLVDAQKLTGILTALSTLLYLTPITISNHFDNTLDPLVNFSEKFLGDTPYTALFRVLKFGTLEHIKSNDEDEESDYESRWTLTNIFSVISGLLGKFLDDKKFRVLLTAYINQSYETDYSQPTNGSSADFEKLIGSLLWHAKPNYITSDFIFKFLSMLKIKGSNLNEVANQISSFNKNLVDVDSVSLLLSDPILYSIVDEYDLADYFEDLLLEKIAQPNLVPRKQGIWNANDLRDFHLIVYRPAYFKSSRTLIAAISSMDDPENEHVSLAVDADRKLTA